MEQNNLSASYNAALLRFQQNIEALADSETSESLSLSMAAFVNKQAQIDQTSKEILQAYCEHLVSLVDRSSNSLRIRSRLVGLETEKVFIAAQESLAVLAHETSQCLSEVINFTTNTTYTKAENALAQGLEFLPEEQRTECEQVFLPKVQKRDRLSLGDLLAFITLLFTILFFLLEQLPDEQQARLIEQNETMIQHQEQAIEVQAEKNKGMLEAVQTLSSTIEDLTDEIDALRKQLDDAGERDDLENQPPEQDTLEQNSDAQNDN